MGLWDAGRQKLRLVAKTSKKKGPLAGASGPSLGRKRPRRAAGTRYDRVAALQQYATAPHKKQGIIPPGGRGRIGRSGGRPWGRCAAAVRGDVAEAARLG